MVCQYRRQARQGRENKVKDKQQRVLCMWRCRQKPDHMDTERPLSLPAFRENWRDTMYPL